MNPNQSIEIQLSDIVGQPVHVGNIVVELNFFTRGSHRYAFDVGRTDETGNLSARYSDVEKTRRENAKENLMDYNTKLDDCDSTVKIVVPSQAQLLQQYDRALRGYGQPPAWANVWPSNAKISAEDQFVRLAETVTIALVPVSWNMGADPR